MKIEKLFIALLFLFGTVGLTIPHYAAMVEARVVGPGAVIGEDGASEIQVTQEDIVECIQGSVNLGCTTSSTLDHFASAIVLNALGGKPKPAGEATAGDADFDPINGDPAQSTDSLKGPRIVYSKGAVGHLLDYTALMYSNPPARTDVYIADVLNSAGFAVAQPAYAQGLGFASLSPVLTAWKSMRNLAYFFFVLVFLVIGFLIMLRHKVSGQTVVTAQQAIPRVIISLLAVTFSYALAGLMIDAMYLFMFMLVGIFGSTSALIDMNFIDLATTLVMTGATSVYDSVFQFVQAITGNLPFYTDEVVAGLGGLSVAVVIAIAILFGVFKLFFILLKTYVSIMVSIVLSPLLLMMGAIPGRNVFGSWVKSIAGNLAAFPVTLLILLIYEQLTGAISGNTVDLELNGGFMPPYLIGVGSGNMVIFLIGFGMILIIGDLVEQAKSALGAGKGPFDVLAQNLADAVKKGWEGGTLVPGLGFTDTRKIPFVGSGKQVLQTGGTLGAGAAGFTGGAFGGSIKAVGAKYTGIGVPGAGASSALPAAGSAINKASKLFGAKDFDRFFKDRKNNKGK